MRGSGVEDIINLIYPGVSTADHIMKGSACHKTLRSHYITKNGAASTFDETELSSNAFEHIRNQGSTAALWLYYMDMIKIIFYIRAQRNSDISLHLTPTRSMLLYFIAAGHHHFAKGARLTLWLYDVWRPEICKL